MELRNRSSTLARSENKTNVGISNLRNPDELISEVIILGKGISSQL